MKVDALLLPAAAALAVVGIGFVIIRAISPSLTFSPSSYTLVLYGGSPPLPIPDAATETISASGFGPNEEIVLTGISVLGTPLPTSVPGTIPPPFTTPAPQAPYMTDSRGNAQVVYPLKDFIAFLILLLFLYSIGRTSPPTTTPPPLSGSIPFTFTIQGKTSKRQATGTFVLSMSITTTTPIITTPTITTTPFISTTPIVTTPRITTTPGITTTPITTTPGPRSSITGTIMEIDIPGITPPIGATQPPPHPASNQTFTGTDNSTGRGISFTTNSAGRYSIAYFMPGMYTLKNVTPGIGPTVVIDPPALYIPLDMCFMGNPCNIVANFTETVHGI